MTPESGGKRGDGQPQPRRRRAATPRQRAWRDKWGKEWGAAMHQKKLESEQERG